MSVAGRYISYERVQKRQERIYKEMNIKEETVVNKHRKEIGWTPNVQLA